MQMKVFFTGAIVLQICCFFACNSKHSSVSASKLKNNPLEKTLLQLETAQLNALNAGDTTELKKILHPEFELIDQKGSVVSSPDFLKATALKSNSGKQEHTYSKSTQFKFFNQQRLAIATGIYFTEIAERRGIVVLTSRFSNVYIQDSTTNWQLLYSQRTRIIN